jgi:hypothetical protein
MNRRRPSFAAALCLAGVMALAVAALLEGWKGILNVY